MIENLYTRFRAYRMENGCVVSYSVDMEFVLIGGRYNDDIAPSIREEMRRRPVGIGKMQCHKSL